MTRTFGAIAAAAVAAVAAAVAAMPAAAQQAAAPAAPPGVVATTNNPNLAVSTVKLEAGRRMSKLIGSDVYNDGNDKVGTVDDLIMTRDDKITIAIISVGGLLGLGSKLVAVPWTQLRQDNDRIVLPGASKDSLNGMPSFEY